MTLLHDNDEYMELLARTVVAIENVFYCTGEIIRQEDEPFVFHYKKKTQKNSNDFAEVTFPRVGSALWKNEILENSDISPFGMNSETVVDEKVRKASHIQKERIVELNIDLNKLEILEKIRSELLPLSSKSIEATLEKINVYEPGGFFTTHRDTPRDEKCFGTLIVGLPSNYVGGQFSLWHSTNVVVPVTLDWGRSFLRDESVADILESPDKYSTDVVAQARQDLDSFTAPCTAPWVAFFGDCEHKIDEVKEGLRITATYILRHGTDTLVEPDDLDNDSDSNAWKLEDMTAKDLKDICRTEGLKVSGNKPQLLERIQSKREATRKLKAEAAATVAAVVTQIHPPSLVLSDAEASQRGKSFYELLELALSDKDFMAEGGLLGIPCFHLYEKDVNLPIDETQINKFVRAKDLLLKGADAIVYVAAARLNLQPRMLAVATESCCRDVFILESWPTLDDARSWTEPILCDDYYPDLGVSYESMESQMPVTIGDALIDRDNYNSVIEWVIDLKGRDVCGKMVSEPLEQVLLDTNISGTGYFGNEACAGTVYCSAAIVLQIPSADDRDIVDNESSEDIVEQVEPKSEHVLAEPVVVRSVEPESMKKGAYVDSDLKRQRLADTPDSITAASATPQEKALLSSSSAEPVESSARMVKENESSHNNKLPSSSSTTTSQPPLSTPPTNGSIVSVNYVDMFSGLKKGYSVEEENAAAQKRFNNYMRRNGNLTVDELRVLADDMQIHYTSKTSQNALRNIIAHACQNSNSSEGRGGGCDMA